jgi:hypothetical protein
MRPDIGAIIGTVDAATAGVIGAAIGAAAGIGGSIVTNVFAARRDRAQWERAQRADGYAHALKHLTIAVVRGSLTDLADAEHFLIIAAGNASASVRDRMLMALSDLTALTQDASEGNGFSESHFGGRVWKVQQDVARCAIDDLGNEQ